MTPCRTDSLRDLGEYLTSGRADIRLGIVAELSDPAGVCDDRRSNKRRVLAETADQVADTAHHWLKRSGATGSPAA